MTQPRRRGMLVTKEVKRIRSRAQDYSRSHLQAMVDMERAILELDDLLAQRYWTADRAARLVRLQREVQDAEWRQR